MYQVRDGQRVAVTCPECGCRLREYYDKWIHFQTGDKYRDARGCECSRLYAGLWFYTETKYITSTGPYWSPTPT